MLSSFFDTGPRRSRQRVDHSPFASTYARTATPPRHSHLGRRRALRYEDEDGSQSERSISDRSDEEGSDENETDGMEEEEATPLLPIFDSLHLDTLPIYTLTHTIRLLVSAKCDTVLTWEQLRSPQVSQFLLKPIQQEIKASHFFAATMYCIMANCLQFSKEVATNPGNSGTVQTRAMVCELLAIKLLREYTTRGLIDALSYDFDPLQGQMDSTPSPPRDHRMSWQSTGVRMQIRTARISCLEIAIRAQAKRFLAHPMVVQQLEAIWDGSIVFHAAADSMHRRFALQPYNYGTTRPPNTQNVAERKMPVPGITRKVVTLYNPRDASLFKLSRLRVPRYRNILSTLSFAILLALFVAVLVQRSIDITALEVVFWIWAGGYMIDEVVGFTEQGFGLYIASFWNVIDLGCVLILFLHFCLRLYGIVMPDIQKRSVANSAFDLLAADAILLFPRLFSVLDHYRYFSQLIIAFRLMAADFVAVFILLLISCSGFFVALTLSFGYDGRDNAGDVAYALLQMFLGFTPAVWDRWNAYTMLGRAILVGFLLLCHFLVLTILITVLTNSFMAVVKNANEEHQFLFAVNTISSVKSDSLFSYVPPFNVLQWTLNPLRYFIPFKQYVKLNRTVIKITHLPILFTIYIYEKTILQSLVVDRIDVVEYRRGARSLIAQRLPRLVKQASLGNMRQDQALEEVFRQPLDATVRTEILSRQHSSNTVNNWMRDMGEEDANPPQEDDPKTVDTLERRRMGERSLSAFSRVRRSSGRPQSAVSDPADLTSYGDFFSSEIRKAFNTNINSSTVGLDQQEDADGDDELQTNDDDDDDNDRMTTDTPADSVRPLPSLDYFSHQSPKGRAFQLAKSLESDSRGSGLTRGRQASSGSGWNSPPKLDVHKRPQHGIRNISSATMVFSPVVVNYDIDNNDHSRPPTAIQSRPLTPASKQTSSGGGKKTPKVKQQSKLRPIFPDKNDPQFRSTPDLSGMLRPAVPPSPRRSSLEMDLVSDIGDNKAIGGGYVGAIPASFATQMAFAAGGLHKQRQERQEQEEMLGRLMMARMNSLEEGFRDVIHEMRENMRSIPGSNNRSPERTPAKERKERKVKDKGKGKERPTSGLKESDSTGSSVLLEPKGKESEKTSVNHNESTLTIRPSADIDHSGRGRDGRSEPQQEG